MESASKVKLVISGSRYLNDEYGVELLIKQALTELGLVTGDISLVIHGACIVGGVDFIADRWAKRHGIDVEMKPVEINRKHPTFARAATARNKEMAQAGTHCIVITQEGKRCAGTKDMLHQWIGVHGATSGTVRAMHWEFE